MPQRPLLQFGASHELPVLRAGRHPAHGALPRHARPRRFRGAVSLRGGRDLGVAGGGDPVVGWLVCVEGPMRGNDYHLHAGYNYIGREIGDVRISGDQQISRQNHAMIAFDDTDGVYYVGPSAGRNLLKVNGKTVLNAVELHSYDVISIGTTKLMFVPLCGEHFSWKKE